jgi:hypothetical protein
MLEAQSRFRYMFPAATAHASKCHYDDDDDCDVVDDNDGDYYNSEHNNMKMFDIDDNKRHFDQGSHTMMRSLQ